MNIFPQEPLSETEQQLLVEILANPTLKKYLHILAFNVGSSIALAVPHQGVSDADFVKGIIAEKGKLQLLDMLLGVSKEGFTSFSNPNPTSTKEN